MKRKTATSPTPSPKKRDGKANTVDRLLAVKPIDLVPKSVERAALGNRKLAGQQAAQLEVDLKNMQKDIDQVAEIRQRLLDVPALAQKVSVL